MQYTDFLNWVDMDAFADSCHNISTAPGTIVLNKPSNRMLKEQFILSALQICNHAKNIQWVDKRDCDLIFDSWNNATIEAKTKDGPMFTEKKGQSKKTVSVKLKNIHESSFKTQRTTLDKKFDHLMIVQNTSIFAIGFISYADVMNYLVPKRDGWMAEIPFDQLNIIYKQDMRSRKTEWTSDLDPKIWISPIVEKEILAYREKRDLKHTDT